MSRDDWRKGIAYFLTGRSDGGRRPLTYWDISRVLTSATLNVFVVYLLISVGIGMWSAYDTNRDAYRQEKVRAQTEQQQASQYIATECAVPGAPVDIVRECLASAVEAYEERKNTDQDLKSQVDMAYWAMVMAIVSAIGLVVSIGGVWLLLRSLRQTEQAISTDREVGYAQVRAYLGMKPMDVPALVVGQRAEVHFEIKNTGQSPAYEMMYFSALFLVENERKDSLHSIFGGGEERPITGPTVPASEISYGEVSTPEPLSIDDIRQLINDGTHTMVFAGGIDYRDVFKTDRTVRFCFLLDRVVEDVPNSSKKNISFSWTLSQSHNQAT